MIIEYELQGSKGLHKGVVDTTGFWIRFEYEHDDVTNEITGAKIYSLSSFSFYHDDPRVALEVFQMLIVVLQGRESRVWEDGVGEIRTLRD